MFHVGPLELLVVFVVALLVIGPERLPGAVKTAGLWVGRFRRSFHKIKAEIEQELNTDEIRRQLHNESILDEIENTKSQVKGLVTQAEKSVSDSGKEADRRQETPTTGDADAKDPVDTPPADTTSTIQTPGSVTGKKTVAGEIREAASLVKELEKEVENTTQDIKDRINSSNADTAKKVKKKDDLA